MICTDMGYPPNKDDLPLCFELWLLYDVIWCYMFSFGGLWVWVKTIWPLKRMVSPSLSTRFGLGRNPSGTRRHWKRGLWTANDWHIPSHSHEMMCQLSTSKQKSIEEMAQKFLEEHGLHDINWADSFICGDEITSHSWDRQTEKMALIWSRLRTQTQQNWTNSLHSSEKCLVAHFHRVWTVLNSVFHIFLAWWWMTNS